MGFTKWWRQGTGGGSAEGDKMAASSSATWSLHWRLCEHKANTQPETKNFHQTPTDRMSCFRNRKSKILKSRNSPPIKTDRHRAEMQKSRSPNRETGRRQGPEAVIRSFKSQSSNTGEADSDLKFR